MIGIYGLVAFSVSRRKREMGIRIAMGATRSDIVWAVLATGLRPVLAGLLLGALSSLAGAAALCAWMLWLSYRRSRETVDQYARLLQNSASGK